MRLAKHSADQAAVWGNRNDSFRNSPRISVAVFGILLLLRLLTSSSRSEEFFSARIAKQNRSKRPQESNWSELSG